MANVNSLQLLRNGQLFASYEAAVDGIKASGTNDGVIKLARYKGNATDSGNTKYSSSNVVKTIFGIYNGAFTGTTTGDAGWTIYDSYTEIIADLQRQIDAMGGDSGSIAEQIQSAINALNYNGVTTGDGVVVTNVTETAGVVEATAANVGNLALTDYVKGSNSGAVASTDSINDAISKLENQVDAVKAEKDAAIADLDYTDTAVSGQYVSQVSETDGVISVTREALPTVAAISEAGKPITAVSESLGAISATAGTINAEYVNVADADNNFTASTVEAVLAEIKSGYTAADAALKGEILGGASASADTLGELEALINNLEAGAATYSIRKDTENLPTNVKEQYVLVETVNGATSDKQVAIPIYKDNTLKSVQLVDQALEFTYIVDSGESVVSVDVSKFLAESEFASGVTVNSNGVAHGVVDPVSENFLTVGADGFKLDGVQDAIDAAVEEAQSDLQDALDELSGKTEALSAKTVTSIASADGSITTTASTAADGTVAYDLSTDASKVKVSSAYTSGTDTAIATGDTVDAALAKLEAQIAAAKAAATVVEKDAAASHITLSSTTGSDGETIYTIGESDIASKSDLDAEIAARKAVDGQNGDTYAANTSANYISGATSLNDADVKLDTALKAVADAAGDVQNEVDAIETAVGLDANGDYVAGDGQYTSGATSVAEAVDALDDAVAENAADIADLQDSYISGITMNGSGVTVTENVAALTATYINTAAESENGMVITTGADGGLTFQFGTLDCGEY